uniref:Uncharacterized protein n=1 Tax=Triticum urartu TaxID=4572 RepID=A0A8R7NYR1_TRIUA
SSSFPLALDLEESRSFRRPRHSRHHGPPASPCWHQGVQKPPRGRLLRPHQREPEPGRTVRSGSSRFSLHGRGISPLIYTTAPRHPRPSQARPRPPSRLRIRCRCSCVRLHRR